jgi:hypothetical protein
LSRTVSVPYRMLPQKSCGWPAGCPPRLSGGREAATGRSDRGRRNTSGMIGSMVKRIPTGDPLAVAAESVSHSGDVVGLSRLLADHPDLATVRLGGNVDSRGDGGITRALLHVVTDCPGHDPNGARRWPSPT